MKHTLLVVLLFALVTVVHGQTPTRTMARTIAVTMDDLPFVRIGEGDYVDRARPVTAKILSALKKHKAPAVGFVNEHMLQDPRKDERIDLLRQWVKSGMILGNHTYSHPDFNNLTVEQFQEEIVKGDVVTRELMRNHQPYQLYFRHPFTHTGDTLEKKEAVDKFLAARGYKVTPHTLENSDWIFNVPYVEAVQKGDKAMAERVRKEYLDFTIAATEFAEKIAPQIFGREIPLLLIIHSNDINADCLDEMLRRFAARGYKFVTLDSVMADPAYQTENTYINKYGPTWFVRWARTKGLKLDFSGDADPPKWVMDLYNHRN